MDYSGLIQPEIMQVLKLSSTSDSSVIWVTHRYKPDFIVFNPEMFSKVMDEEIYQNCTLRFVFQGTTNKYGSNLAIYHCEWKKSKINFIVSVQFHVPKKLIAIQMEVQDSFR